MPTPNRTARSWRLLLVPLLAFGGCSHEEHPVAEPVIAAAPEGTLVGLSNITFEGRHVGYLETWRLSGGAGSHELQRISDLKRNRLGYIDDRGVAWRYSAHEGTELVANSTDVRKNVTAVMGYAQGRVELVDQVAR